MKRISKKNISPILQDIKLPAGHFVGKPHPRVVSRSFAVSPRHVYQQASKTKNVEILVSKHWGMKIGLGLAGIAVFILIFLFINFAATKEKITVSARSLHQSVLDSFEEFQNLKPQEAKKSLTRADEELKTLKDAAGSSGLLKIGGLLGVLIPPFGNIPQTFSSLERFFQSAIELVATVEELKRSGISYFINDSEGKFLGLLENVRKNLAIIAESGGAIVQQMHSLQDSPVKKYIGDFDIKNNLSLLTELYSAQDFLNSAVSLLKKPGGFHFAVFFQNPSEMRPSGGFIGSYADLTVKNGSITSIKVSDIYDPDGQFEEKVVPPKPLQAITTNWEARDANWFFDFPTSAEKVLGFFDASKIYREKDIVFDGALALNTNVIETILGVTGPIELSDYKLAVSRENFLAEVQKEVETGRNKEKGEPKRILKDLTPLLLERLKNLNDEEKDVLISAFQRHIQKKDIQAYFRNPAIEGFMMKYGIGGEVYRTTSDFEGNYLAVVNANIAGGKSDIFVEQSVSLQTTVDFEGNVNNKLTIRRSHKGNASKYSWYRAANQNYLRVLVPNDAKLLSVNGGTSKTVNQPIAYGKEGYRTDPDVFQLEQAGKESGKTVFGSWFTVPAGASKSIVFEYRNPYKIDLRSGAKYQFIFDRQSGVKESLSVSVQAPAGFKWVESDGSVFEYASDDPDGRVIIDLTLEEV